MIPPRRPAVPRRALRWLAASALALALSAAAGAETLTEAIEAAYANNPVLQQQRYLQKTRDEQYVQSRAQYGPTLQVQTQGTYDYVEQLGFKSDGTLGQVASDATTGRTVGTVSQTLYTAGRIRGQVASALANVRAGQENVRQAEQQTVQNVIAVYAAVLRDEARVVVGRENVFVLRGQLEQNTKRQQVGDVTLTDRAQSDARLAAAEIQLATLESDLAVARGQYRQVVGHNPGTLEPLPRLPDLPGSIDVAFDSAEAHNPALLAAKYTEESSSAQAASRRGERGPTVSVQAQGIYTNRLLRFEGRDGRKELVGGVTVSQPLFSGGAIESRVREADARNGYDQAGIDSTRRQVLQTVTQSWAQLAATRQSLSFGERQLQSAQQAFAGMRCEELNGLRSTIETLNAEQEFQSAQLQLLQNRYQLYVSHAGLLAAMGVLDAKTIATNIQVYDPNANFERVRHYGLTPFDYVGMGLDRLLSASPRRPLSADLTGADVPQPERQGALPPEPGPELLHGKLAPIPDALLRLDDGGSTRCPLSDTGARR